VRSIAWRAAVPLAVLGVIIVAWAAAYGLSQLVPDDQSSRYVNPFALQVAEAFDTYSSAKR